MKKGYALYGKEGTLVLDLDADQLLLGLKSEGAKLKPVTLEESKIASWRVLLPGFSRPYVTHNRTEHPASFVSTTATHGLLLIRVSAAFSGDMHAWKTRASICMMSSL